MSVKVYENGAWVEKAPMIYKDGAWVKATSVKVYENGAWVEKLINYKNMTIAASGAGFSENSTNYVRCSGNNIVAQIARSKTSDISIDINFIPPTSTSHFGKTPNITFDLYVKNSNVITSGGTYGKISVTAGGSGYNYSTTTYGYVVMNADAETITKSVNHSIRVTNSYSENMNIGTLKFSVIVYMASDMTIAANSYIEISNITVSGVPYGVNTVIMP